jgi:hypothetical protein
MQNAYGYIRLTEGVDGDHIDCYIGPDKDSPYVFIVRQKNPKDSMYDEDKVMLGFWSEEEARDAYLAHYDDPNFLGEIDEYSMSEFKKLLKKRRMLGLLGPVW